LGPGPGFLPAVGLGTVVIGASDGAGVDGAPAVVDRGEAKGVADRWEGRLIIVALCDSSLFAIRRGSFTYYRLLLHRPTLPDPPPAPPRPQHPRPTPYLRGRELHHTYTTPAPRRAAAEGHPRGGRRRWGGSPPALSPRPSHPPNPAPARGVVPVLPPPPPPPIS